MRDSGSAVEHANSELDVLLVEYAQMRDEIRASYSQLFSVAFGVLATGIGIASYQATTDRWLAPFVPLLVCSWMAVVTYIRTNIQHIAKNVSALEQRINEISSSTNLIYETSHADQLWKSWAVLVVGLVAILPLGAIYVATGIAGFHYLRSGPAVLGCSIPSWVAYVYGAVTVGLLVLTGYFLLRLPRHTTGRS